MSRRRKHRKAVIHGVVTPEDWDDGDGLTHVSIITDDYEKYEVFCDDIGKELSDYHYETVRAFGVVEIGGEGNTIIRITDFSPYEDEGGDAWDEAI